MSDRTELDLCPDCGGLRITELTSIGTVGISLDGGPDQPAELWIGLTPTPCDHAPAWSQPQYTIKVTELPVDLPRELAIDWGLIDPDTPPGPTPIQRALDILAPHLAWDPRYRP
ncbi:hypothetical protein [Streptomyces bullii]|uniref:Uncharacterized protein n=1 Tax=Streptomyces bullii TaxID=349910 RepID=A0ABW0US01_9ACTN